MYCKLLQTVVQAASTTAAAPGPSMYCKLFSTHTHCCSELESADVRTRPSCVPLIYIENCSHSYSGLHTVQGAKLDLRQLLSVGYECNVAAEDTFKSISSMNQYRFITRQPVSIA